MKLVLFAIGGLLVLLSALSRVRSARWWMRFADFPRLQIAFSLLAVLMLHTILYGWESRADILFSLVALAALLYQAWRIYPYTMLAPKQVQDARPGDPRRTIRILVSNVLMENRRAETLLALIRAKDPDLVLAVETDDWWTERLRVLDVDFPHRLKQPQGNHYGLNFFSKLELREPQLRFLLEKDIPSVRTGVRLRSGEWIEFYGLHPQPPEVQEDTEPRDAEILIVGREIRADGRPSIVAGDLNDVAWSHTTRMFQRISGTLDPRQGRGTFNTFHAHYPMFRWPLDHIFHETSFTLIRLERLPDIGSDHFPVFAELQYEPAAEAQQDTPEPDRQDLNEAQDKLEDGKEVAVRVERNGLQEAGIGSGDASSPRYDWAGDRFPDDQNRNVRIPLMRFRRISAAKIGPSLCHQNRTISWLTSMPRLWSRSSTFLSERRNQTQSITARRTSSGLVRKYRNGLRLVAPPG